MVEDDLQWKTTFGGKQTSVEENLRWRTPFGERQPLVEDDLWLKTTFGGRHPSAEDDLWWQKTFGGARPSAVAPPLTATAQLSSNRNYYQLSQLEIEFAMYEALYMYTPAEKRHI